MGRGYWPIGKREGYHGSITRIVSELKDVAADIGYDDGQFDNAYGDGWHKSRFWLAIELLMDCIERE
jgi:hypothetical protein